jgi:elongation factor 1-beta
MLRLQKKGQQSSGARHAAQRSNGATGAGSRVSLTPVENAVLQGRDVMGSVAVIVRVMPESPDINYDELKSALKAKLPGIQEMREEPIGFGLKAIKLAAVINDAGGETDAVEQALNTVPGVERAEIIEVTLM